MAADSPKDAAQEEEKKKVNGATLQPLQISEEGNRSVRPLQFYQKHETQGDCKCTFLQHPCSLRSSGCTRLIQDTWCATGARHSLTPDEDEGQTVLWLKLGVGGGWRFSQAAPRPAQGEVSHTQRIQNPLPCSFSPMFRLQGYSNSRALTCTKS